MDPKIENVPMKLVDRPKDPIRSKIDPEKIRELAESIREMGLQQPVLLRPMDGRYEVVAGDRRYLAHKFLSAESILAIVKELSDEDTVIIRATENLQREDLTPMEEARIYGGMRNGLGFTIEKVARKMGRSHATIKKYLDLLTLDPEFQEAIDGKKLGVEAAYVLMKVDDREFRNYYLKAAIENGITMPVAITWVEEYKRSKEGRYYEAGGAGSPLSPENADRAIYSTCGACNGPVDIKAVKYIPFCPECVKELLRR